MRRMDLAVRDDGLPAALAYREASRLVVVSNRVAAPATVQTGGLAVAMAEALEQNGGMWFGWSGRIDQRAVETKPSFERSETYSTLTVDLSPEEHRSYYLGYSNGCLWPVLHYRLDLLQACSEHPETYFAVNARFAKTLSGWLTSSDRVWVHDYHLMPFGAELRKHVSGIALAFFLHIPFPPPEIFSGLPQHERLARGLFAYDLIGFQTKGDRDNFARYAVERLGARRLFDDKLSWGDRIVQLRACPIGIDAARFARDAADAVNHSTLRRLRSKEAGRLVVGVDRLDYSKGLPQRLAAFEKVLQKGDGYLGDTTLLQFAPPSREGLAAYKAIRSEVEYMAGHINSRHGSLGHTPVQVLATAMPRSVLAGLFRLSRVGLVTPLRDGMNLVAKEYVAAQDPEDPGVLVLSCFAGAAQQLRSALLVNPHDVDEVAAALEQALTMSLEERRERHHSLWRNVASENLAWWRERFLAAFERCAGALPAPPAAIVEAA